MAIELEYPPGATPLDPDEAAGLIPSHIATLEQLNEWELANILEGERWAFARKHKRLIESDFVRGLHKRMFGDTWRWAGTFRDSGKKIGLDPADIQPALHNLCEDVKAQLKHESYPLDEIAARFSHKLVWIHPFANGNGRLSRTMADVLLVQYGASRFSWGAGNLVADGEVRQRYLHALRAADARDYRFRTVLILVLLRTTSVAVSDPGLRPVIRRAGSFVRWASAASATVYCIVCVFEG